MDSFASGCGSASEGFAVDGQIAWEGTFLSCWAIKPRYLIRLAIDTLHDIRGMSHRGGVNSEMDGSSRIRIVIISCSQIKVLL